MISKASLSPCSLTRGPTPGWFPSISVRTWTPALTWALCWTLTTTPWAPIIRRRSWVWPLSTMLWKWSFSTVPTIRRPPRSTQQAMHQVSAKLNLHILVFTTHCIKGLINKMVIKFQPHIFDRDNHIHNHSPWHKLKQIPHNRVHWPILQLFNNTSSFVC